MARDQTTLAIVALIPINAKQPAAGPTYPWSLSIWHRLADAHYCHDDKVASSPACWAVSAYIIVRPHWALCSCHWLPFRVRLSDVRRCFERVCTWSPSAQNTAKITCRCWAGGQESKWLCVGPFPCLISHYVCFLVCQMCWLNKKTRNTTGLYWTCFHSCSCFILGGNAVQ